MDYYCGVCYKYIKPQSKYKHFKSTYHKKLDRCNHVKIINENPNINEIDDLFYANIIENIKNDYYLLKCEFKLVFSDNQYCPYVTSTKTKV